MVAYNPSNIILWHMKLVITYLVRTKHAHYNMSEYHHK